jgi:riboflavin kinase/FMN adenylyltransferase
MRLIRLNKSTPALNQSLTRPLALTIGNFDGIHLGHQAIIEQLINTAKAQRCASALITFEPSPSEYFLETNAPARITSLTERLALLKKTKIDYVIIMRFTTELAQLSAEDFVQLLCQKLNMRYLLVGDDFRFGKNRSGDFALLEILAKKNHYIVEQISTVHSQQERISSTRIRHALEEADLTTANCLLGRAYTISGRVIHGDARGRTIGFPTANIALKRKRAPLRGVYAVKVYGLPQGIVYGVANIGNRPTINGTYSLLEVYLFDFSQDIYGHYLQVEFCQKIRAEQRFDSLDALKAQILQDVMTTKDYFKLSSAHSRD